MEWSSYQKDIFKFIKESNQSLVIDGVAGCGKTSTIIEAINYIPKDKNILFLAFNKHIVSELKGKITASNVKIATFHGMGFSVYREYIKYNPDLEVKQYKVQNIIRKFVEENHLELVKDVIRDLVSIAKQTGMYYLIRDKWENWQEIIDYFDLYLDLPQRTEEDRKYYNKIMANCVRTAGNVLKESNKQHLKLDFNDMIYFPLLRNIQSKTKYDVIFVDEAQDCNNSRIHLLKNFLNTNGRVIGVGDKHQAILGFTGVKANVLDTLQEMYGAVTLPLSICYRCSNEIIKEAKEYVPNIKGRKDAPEGAIQHWGTTYTLTDFKPSDAILCRNNKPIIKMAYDFMQAGIACKVLGREIGQGLIAFLKQFKDSQTVGNLKENIKAYWGVRKKALTEEEKFSKLAAEEDKIASILVLTGSMPLETPFQHLIDIINEMFSNTSKNILTLSTIHKTKGVEWDTVFFLDSSLIPSKYAWLDWQKEQEKNLKYVAITRAKNELIYITSQGKDI